ncbi:MAG TPA: hypothetical protein VJ385_22490 [Fibrobacteria bacterium]|nr:hypothetical protein [Fibrobacteria bacterium]
MKNDLMLLTLLYAVAFTAFIGAINSRGPARVALSYFLAILTLCAAVFHTSQFLAGDGLHGDDAVVVAPPPQPLAPPEPVAPPPPDTAALAASQNEAAIAEGKNELKGVLEAARRVARSMSSLSLGAVADISDEEYESLQNRAVGYLAEARRAKDRLAAAASKIPPQLKDPQDQLAKGLESLVSSAYNAERFFKSENDTEEKQHAAAFRKGLQDANASFKKAGTALGSEEAGE